MTEHEGWREVLREVDYQVTVAETAQREVPGKMNKGILDAWKRAQKALTDQIRRQQEGKSSANDE